MGNVDFGDIAYSFEVFLLLMGACFFCMLVIFFIPFHNAFTLSQPIFHVHRKVAVNAYFSVRRNFKYFTMSTNRKGLESSTKTLRDLASIQENRFCFDCGQRGPTYINMSIGSFVCTRCGGAL